MKTIRWYHKGRLFLPTGLSATMHLVLVSTTPGAAKTMIGISCDAYCQAPAIRQMGLFDRR